MPKQLGEDEVRGRSKDVTRKQGAVGMEDRGEGMKGVMVRTGGEEDGKGANNVVKGVQEVG